MDVGERSRFSDGDQLTHFRFAFSSKGWKEMSIKEDHVRWIFDDLGVFFHSVLGSRESHVFRGDWPFKLLVTVVSETDQYRYTPRSDYHISVDKLVHLMVEVQSETNESDRYRMLLQGACAARLGRKFCGFPFIVMALYIENSGRVTRYFLFQNDGSDEVSYVSDVQYWTQTSELFQAVFEMYNLASIISKRPEIKSIQRRIVLLNSDIAEHHKDTFTSRSDASEGGEVYHDCQVVDAFTWAGYTLESNGEDENGWAPLNRLKSTMRRARHSSGTAVIVKLLRPGSNELPILQYLHSFTSSDNYILPLVATFKLDVGTFILLPEITPLDLGFKFQMFRNKGADFSRQLIEGVAYLHRCDIAHLDIKPQNIVAHENRLFIIDFDISVRVDGPDELIDRWCGTPKWMAPEIGRQGPKCSYSPIRADLWSCGLMLRYLASKGVVQDNRFKPLTQQLLNINPQLRPLLGQQSSVTVLGDRNGRLKRKLEPDALPHDAKRLAIAGL